MVTGRCRRAAFGGVAAVAALSVAGCAGGSGRHSPAGSPAAGAESVAPGRPAASICSRAVIRAAIGGFFGAWNHRDLAALRRLFAPAGELDLTTKYQHAADGTDSWSSAGGGAGASGQIAAFGERQWRLGERLSYRGIRVVLNGGGHGHGGYAGHVVARFADGTVQPMGYAKFIYGCASRAFLHVVIISTKAASPT